MNHKINLTQGAVRYLRDMLASTGWAKSINDIILGGGLLVDVLPEPSEPPTTTPVEREAADQARIRLLAHTADVKAWAALPVPEFDVTEKQRDCIRRCIKHFAELGNIPPTPQAYVLLTAFGYSSD